MLTLVYIRPLWDFQNPLLGTNILRSVWEAHAITDGHGGTSTSCQIGEFLALGPPEQPLGKWLRMRPRCNKMPGKQRASPWSVNWPEHGLFVSPKL